MKGFNYSINYIDTEGESFTVTGDMESLNLKVSGDVPIQKIELALLAMLQVHEEETKDLHNTGETH